MAKLWLLGICIYSMSYVILYSTFVLKAIDNFLCLHPAGFFLKVWIFSFTQILMSLSYFQYVSRKEVKLYFAWQDICLTYTDTNDRNTPTTCNTHIIIFAYSSNFEKYRISKTVGINKISFAFDFHLEFHSNFWIKPLFSRCTSVMSYDL